MLGNHPDFDWIQTDLAEGKPVLPDVQVCIHAAGISPRDGVSTFDFVHHNVTATQNLLLSLQESNCKQLIYLSAVSVYGEVSQTILNEETPSTNVQPYGLSKLLAEKIILDQHSLSSCILRLPGVLGQGASTAWLVKQIHKAIRNENIIISNPDSQFNNAVWADDLCDFILRILLLNSQPKTQTFLLGAADSLNVREIIDLIIKETGSVSKIVEADGPRAFTLDASRARKMHFLSKSLRSMVKAQIDIENQYILERRLN